MREKLPQKNRVALQKSLLNWLPSRYSKSSDVSLSRQRPVPTSLRRRSRPTKKRTPKTKARVARKRKALKKATPAQAARRPAPDRTRTQKLDACPDCGGKLKDTGDTRERITEDIPEDLKPVITKDIIHRDWCPKCKKRIEPKPPDVLPHCQIGNRALVFSSMLHYLQGLTISQIVDTLNFHLSFKVTEGGLVQMWQRLGKILYSWYQEIHEQSLESSKLYADETGWRVQGQTHWLWCFTSDQTVYFMVDKSRGSPALQKFFTRYFDGTLITDFWSPYDAIDCADKQKCWPHLLRDMAKVDEQNQDDKEWRFVLASGCERVSQGEEVACGASRYAGGTIRRRSYPS